MSSIPEQASQFFHEVQTEICGALQRLDGVGHFSSDTWHRAGGGGGIACVMERGRVFEKAGVNVSKVYGELSPDFAKNFPGEGLEFFATGISLVIHPQNPFVPTVHANFRCIRRGSLFWFGGGSDLTPYYPEMEDVVHFHRTWKECCDRHDPDYYPQFKKYCDEYFFLNHRQEARGIGGIFFDNLTDDHEKNFKFVQDGARTFLTSYLPIVERRQGTPFSPAERDFQLYRRGRYVEFNLLYDRGTIFGLKTDGRTESILMSLPPLVRWGYDVTYPAGTREASLSDWLRPRDWLG